MRSPRQLDLVDSGHEALVAHEDYRSTYVYGNAFIEYNGEGNSRITFLFLLFDLLTLSQRWFTTEEIKAIPAITGKEHSTGTSLVVA